jgi:osmotically inducible protein OsmC
VPNLNEEKFIELAEEAKKNCPISGVLNCEIILNASLD